MNVDVLTVAAVIASLKLTVTAEFTATFVAPFSGLTLVTVGGVMSGFAAVVKAELNGVRPLFARSLAPLDTLTV